MKNTKRSASVIGAVYIVIIMLFLYLPILALTVLSFNESKSMSVFTGFSLRWYREMFQNKLIINSVINTFAIALTASLGATAIGTAACLGMSGMKKKSQDTIMAFNSIPMLNADIVTGISLMLTFIMFKFPLGYVSVLLAHITFCIPYVVLSVRPRLNKGTTTLYEAAQDLGASKWYAFSRIVMPELMPGMISGFLLSFTMSVDDFIVTYFTRGAGINTISTLIYSQVKVGIRPTLFALSTVIFAVALVVLLVSNLEKPEEDGRETVRKHRRGKMGRKELQP